MSTYHSTFPVTLALSAHWHTYPERFTWILEHGFAIEYSPNPEAFDSLPAHLDPFLKSGIPIRYHGFFPRYEFGHQNPERAKQALQVHHAALDAMHRLGEQVSTFHVGLNRNAPLDHSRVVDNLAHLVEHGNRLGITVCLENLRMGPTSHPATLLEWANRSGAMITLDVGHATSNQYVQRGEFSAVDFVLLVADRLVEVHMYERETDQHHAPEDMTLLGPIVDALLETQCTWWTIELNAYDDALKTRSLLKDYLQAR